MRSYFYILPYPLPAGTPVPYTPGLPNVNPLNYPPHAFEPTSTLVLTSTSKVFIDIRIFKRIQPSDPELPNDGGHRERLEWAFAGKSTSYAIPDPHATPQHAGGGQGQEQGRQWVGPVQHAIWSHWVDSRYPVGAIAPKDEGTMYPVSATQTLEHGSSINPYTGAMMSYEEMWLDVPVQTCFPSTSKFSIVLVLDAPEAKVRGVVIRLGQYCQGIIVRDAVSTIERWGFEEKKGKNGKVVGGDWKRVARIGDDFLPCATTFQPEILTVGGRVRYGNHEWFVDEKVEWQDVMGQ